MKWILLINALVLSGIAAWYSIAGLVAIFAAAAIPVMIMGGILEISKLSAVVFLHRYWTSAPRMLKSYLAAASLVLMLITSMGIFGFLSKAHLEQTVSGGDVKAEITLIDDRIQIEKDNIEAAKRTLTQMDEQVEQVLGRSKTEGGARRAATLRKSQAKERESILNDIQAAQRRITELNSERAVVNSQFRRIEAEVGPIRYVAALVYGDDVTDQSTLEKAIRWVTVLIVAVFDPLAVSLLLAWSHLTKTREPEIVQPPHVVMAPPPMPPMPVQREKVTPTPEIRVTSPGVDSSTKEVHTYDGRNFNATIEKSL